MEVIFTETQKGQFQIGQQRFVKAGFARNYLLPQKLAVPVTNENLQQIKSLRRKADKKLKEVKQAAENVKDQIHGKEITFKVKTHDEGHLYGSISAQDIANEINKSYKTVLDKYDIGLTTPIRQASVKKIAINIHKDVAILITINILGEEEKPKEVKSKITKKAKAAEDQQEEAPEATEETTADSKESA